MSEAKNNAAELLINSGALYVGQLHQSKLTYQNTVFIIRNPWLLR